MYQGVLIAGFGGQGVISAGVLLTYAGMLDSKHVTFFPSYGAEMRGGTANCTVVVSDEEVASPIVAHPSTLIVMNEPSFLAFEANVAAGGVMLVNSSLVTHSSTRSDIEILQIPVNNLAEEVGTIKCANMVMLGAFCKKTGAVSIDAVCNSLPKIFKKATSQMIDQNIAAIQKGAVTIQ